MGKSVHPVAGIRREVGRIRAASAAIAAAAACRQALSAVTITVTAVPALGWGRSLRAAALSGARLAAPGAGRRAAASRCAGGTVPFLLPEGRCHGSLDAVTDSERRPLRSIAASAHDVASRTGELLAELLAVPGVRIFCGVRPAATDLPRTPHVVSAGRRLVLMESVAWPPGRYDMTDGRVHCDGTYIGQSVRPLLAAVQHWREVLPRNHHVSAMIVVHGGGGVITLPAPVAGDLAWVQAEDAVREARQRILRGRPAAASRAAVAALLDAVDSRA